MSQTDTVNEAEFTSQLDAARTTAEVYRLIHIDLPAIPAGNAAKLMLMAYWKLEAVADQGQDGTRGGRGYCSVDELL